jgi:thioredoxin reductase
MSTGEVLVEPGARPAPFLVVLEGELQILRPSPDGRRVHMLVRGDGLAETMSRYLIRRIEDSPAITLHTRTEVVALEGNGHLARVDWSSGSSSTPERHDIKC